MRTAIVHDYFVQMGGAERVAEELFRFNRDAAVFATVALPERLPELLRETVVHTTWLQHLPYLDRFYRLYFLLYPLGVRTLDLSGFDCILSSSSGYAKGIRVPRHAIHICYCHTPMRWVWSYDKYTERESGMGRAVKWGIRQAVRFLQLWDLQASRQPDHFIANSRAVAERIKTCYGRIAEVIYPPINVNRFSLSSHQGDHYLILSRLVAYKRIDLAVGACTQLGRKLIVAGSGPDLEELKKIAGPTVTFAGRVSDEEAVRLAAECRALIFPGEEDFGMTPLEVAESRGQRVLQLTPECLSRAEAVALEQLDFLLTRAAAEPVWTLLREPAAKIPFLSSARRTQASREQVLEHFRHQFDCILLDAPGVSQHADRAEETLEACAFADGVLMVVAAGRTTRAEIRDAQLAITGAGGKLEGCCLNRRRQWIPTFLQRWFGR